MSEICSCPGVKPADNGCMVCDAFYFGRWENTFTFTMILGILPQKKENFFLMYRAVMAIKRKC